MLLDHAARIVVRVVAHGVAQLLRAFVVPVAQMRRNGAHMSGANVRLGGACRYTEADFGAVAR